MPAVRCPHCENPLTLEERSRANCPSCGKPLHGVTATEPVRARESSWERQSDEPLWDKSPKAAMRTTLAWASTRTALSLFAIGLILLVIGSAFTAFLGATQRPFNRPPVVQAFLLNLAIGLGAILALTGVCMSCVVPPASGGTGWAVGAVLCVVVLAVVQLIILIQAEAAPVRFGAGGGGPRDRTAYTVITLIAGFLGHVFYTLFLWSVARYLRNSGLAIGVIVYLLVSTLFALGLLVLVLLSISRAGGPAVDRLFSGPGMLYFILAMSTILSVWLFVQALLVRSSIVTALLKRDI